MPKPSSSPRRGKTLPEIKAYIDALPPPIKRRFTTLWRTMRAEAPHAVERMSYGMPTLHQGENLVHLCAFTRHIGVYPGSAAIADFAPELGAFKTSKGTIQIPHDDALPLDLVRRITRHRVERASLKQRSSKHSSSKHSSSKRAPAKSPRTSAPTAVRTRAKR